MNNLDQAFAKMNLDGLFIVWGPFHGSRRSNQIAKKLNIDIEYIYLMTKRGLFYAFFKYVHQAIATLLLLVRKRPDIVFIQNPPTFAPLFVYIYCFLSGAKFIIDTHTGALVSSLWRCTLPLQRFLSRRALITILTNEYLSEEVSSWGASSFVLEDPPMAIEISKTMILNKSIFSVVMMCGVYPDEPVPEVIKVARYLPNMDFYITGNFENNKYFQTVVRNSPANVHFTGFLPEEEYFGLLNAVDAIICLTTDDHTFQSGANEALWLGKPLVTSDWKILRQYFSKGTVHVDNTAGSIQKGLQEIQRDYPDFQYDLLVLQKKRRRQWYKKAENLLNFIHKNIRRP